MTSYIPKSKSNKWKTPPEIYDPLNSEFHFNYDPCPIDWIDGNLDGLNSDWGSCSFVNPPYDKVSDWIKKSYDEYKKGKIVVMLINAITDTIAFHKYIYNICEIRFIKGRIKFIDPSNPSKRNPNVKASMIVIFK
jgi:phage N-6-adenine-methyltransferase